MICLRLKLKKGDHLNKRPITKQVTKQLRLPSRLFSLNLTLPMLEPKIAAASSPKRDKVMEIIAISLVKKITTKVEEIRKLVEPNKRVLSLSFKKFFRTLKRSLLKFGFVNLRNSRDKKIKARLKRATKVTFLPAR
jgi:hypothetical protein